MLSITIIALLSCHIVRAYPEESYLLPDPRTSFINPDYEMENQLEVRRRNNNNFLRFGRSEIEYEDLDKYPRPTRGSDKNDYFIRFGRGNQDYLRFGRDELHNRMHDERAANHLRFGRSSNEDGNRRKRSTNQEDFKRTANSNFLRFGRNSNYMRFGRDRTLENEDNLLSFLKEYQNSPLLQLLVKLKEDTKAVSNECKKSE